MDKLIENVWYPVEVEPSEYANIRHNPEYRVRDNNPSLAYEEFRDVGPRGANAFLEDTKKAISNNSIGPSWGKFIKCLTEGSLFAIITARGHEYNTLKEGVKYIIDNCLTSEQKDNMYDKCLSFANYFDNNDEFIRHDDKFSDNKLIERYLECCRYYGVGAPYSKSFSEEFTEDTSIKIEEAKKMVLDRFIQICDSYGQHSNLNVSLGFSDDDKKNVEHIKKYFEYKSTIYERMKLNVYDTSNREQSVKTSFGGVLETVQGKEGSLLRFNNFNSMSNNLQNATNDFSEPNYSDLQKSKVANSITKSPKRKFIKKFKKKA